MLDNFLAFTKENKLIQKGDSILVGVSGGVDSVVLLDILSKLQKKLGIQIAAAHVNYGLRKESDRDEKFVESLAKKYEFPIFVEKVKLHGGNIEEKARDVRYSFFNQVAEKQGFSKIAVAHHKNDLVETFFLNLLRGSGLTGLTSMKPKSGKLIRPLLFATRSEIESYEKKNKLGFVEDISNRDLKFKRNLMRYKVIPEIEKTCPDLVETISTEIDDLRAVQDIVTKITRRYYKKVAKEGEGSITISMHDLAQTNPYIQSEVLREIIRYVKGDLKDISRKNIRDIQLLLKDTYGTKEVHLGGGLIARRTYDKLDIRKTLKKPVPKPKNTVICRGKETVFGDWRLFLRESDRKNASKSKNLVFLNIQKELKLLVRCRKPGDRVGIGGGKTKSLQDEFVDAKIPRDKRDVYPIVVTKNDEVVWIPGVRLNPKYKSDLSKKYQVSLEAKRK